MTGSNERLRLNDHQHIFALCQGDFTAYVVCIRILKLGKSIDPSFDCSFFRRLGSLGIIGGKICTLWNDVCGKSEGKLIALIRACEHGLAGVNKEILLRTIVQVEADPGVQSEIDTDAVVKAVKHQFPNFNPEATPMLGEGKRRWSFRLFVLMRLKAMRFKLRFSRQRKPHHSHA